MNLVGAIFFMAVSMFMGSYMMTTQSFQNERPVFLREYANKMYTVLPYYLAKVLADIPAYVIVPFIYTTICYFTIGFTISTEIYFGFLITMILDTISAVSLGYFISSAFSDGATALTIAPILVMPLMLVGGFFSNSAT
jgi:ABC-type multidrug transport system permease subunit